MSRRLFFLLAAAPGILAAQGQPQAAARDTTPPAAAFGVTEWQQARRKLELDMQRTGFSVYIIADMEGLSGVVRNQTEMRPVARGGSEEHERFREILTREVNAVIAGARAAGATQFIVNDGHGGTLFRNILPEQLDPDAILIRGYPKPIVMSTGMNPMVDAMMIVGAHANAGTAGVIAHSFAFDSFTVNGTVLNETGIADRHDAGRPRPQPFANGQLVALQDPQAMLGPLRQQPAEIVEVAGAIFDRANPAPPRHLDHGLGRQDGAGAGRDVVGDDLHLAGRLDAGAEQPQVLVGVAQGQVVGGGDDGVRIAKPGQEAQLVQHARRRRVHSAAQ